MQYIHACPLHTVPVRTDGRVVGELVVVDSILALCYETLLNSVGPDAGHAHYGLLEVRVYRRTCGGLQTLQLT